MHCVVSLPEIFVLCIFAVHVWSARVLGIFAVHFGWHTKCIDALQGVAVCLIWCSCNA